MVSLQFQAVCLLFCVFTFSTVIDRITAYPRALPCDVENIEIGSSWVGHGGTSMPIQGDRFQLTSKSGIPFNDGDIYTPGEEIDFKYISTNPDSEEFLIHLGYGAQFDNGICFGRRLVNIFNGTLTTPVTGGNLTIYYYSSHGAGNVGPRIGTPISIGKVTISAPTIDITSNITITDDSIISDDIFAHQDDFFDDDYYGFDDDDDNVQVVGDDGVNEEVRIVDANPSNSSKAHQETLMLIILVLVPVALGLVGMFIIHNHFNSENKASLVEEEQSLNNVSDIKPSSTFCLVDLVSMEEGGNKGSNDFEVLDSALRSMPVEMADNQQSLTGDIPDISEVKPSTSSSRSNSYDLQLDSIYSYPREGESTYLTKSYDNVIYENSSMEIKNKNTVSGSVDYESLYWKSSLTLAEGGSVEIALGDALEVKQNEVSHLPQHPSLIYADKEDILENCLMENYL